MRRCEHYSRSKGSTAFLDEYRGGEEVVICGIEECPYGNKGSEIRCRDSVTRNMCNSKGLIQKVEPEGVKVSIQPGRGGIDGFGNST